MNSNFRHHLLSLSLLIGVATPWVATAQAPISNAGSGSIEDRVIELERISNARGQLLTELQKQVSATQDEIDSLRGQIQENQYQLQQVVERQKQIYQQIDGLSSKGGQSPSAAAGGSAATTPGTGAGATNTSSTSPASVPASSGDANSDYNEAVALVLEKKQYDQAIVAFQNFIKKYPDSTFQPNANYWLGQLYYTKGKKDDAAYYFANVVKNYPKSPKASEALFKVGVIMQEKGQPDKAKAVYQQVIKIYPNTEGAKQARKRLAAL
ncbi:cell division protein CpoB [Prodigiosinella aquatilis]|nr:cell division protein CpoB [Prodigiosinella sp. LS101]WJV55230.1 cell division protein CpoB [Prodigiosinella sp. LS101]WJV59591.1 cell division protein CpoB [Pectobacteriaceae bacterium C111]